MAYLKCEFMSRHVGDTFRAIVVSVLDLGVYAQILSNSVEGYIPIERQFAVDLNDKTVPALFSLGQHILIEVDEVDILARKIYFNLVPGRMSFEEERK